MALVSLSNRQRDGSRGRFENGTFFRSREVLVKDMAAGTEESLYTVLGVPSTATQAEIQSAFKKRARQLHPDVNKAKDAEEKFKRLVAAYEVLKDEEKRARYDAFGIVNGQSFRRRPTRPARPKSAPRGKAGSKPSGSPFDDFNFDFGDLNNPFDYILRRQQKKRAKEREVQLTIPLDQAFNGTTRSITLEAPAAKGDAEAQRFKIRIPPGAREGDRLKIKDSSIVVVLHVELHPKFEIEGRDITTTLELSPWEAALGAEIEIAAPGGSAMKVKVPSGTSSGQRLRCRGQGLPVKPGKDGEPGDLYVRIKIAIPRTSSEAEQALWRQLAEASTFNPRTQT